MTFQKIPGQALCGFADMFEDETRQHLVGGQLTVQSGVASKAKKWTKTPIDKKKAAVLHPVHNVSNLLAAANRVSLVLSGALRKAQQKKAATAAATTAARVNVTRAATSSPSVQRAAMARMVAVHGLMGMPNVSGISSAVLLTNADPDAVKGACELQRVHCPATFQGRAA